MKTKRRTRVAYGWHRFWKKIRGRWVMVRRVRLAVFALALLCSSTVYAQQPVRDAADRVSWGTAGANPGAAAVAAWRSEHPACNLGRLAISEGIGNGITLAAKRSYESPRPCLGCAPDGFPSGHAMNAAIGSSTAWGGGWRGKLIATGLVIVTGYLRHDANRHTWRQVAAGALIGFGAEAAGQLIPCGE